MREGGRRGGKEEEGHGLGDRMRFIRAIQYPSPPSPAKLPTRAAPIRASYAKVHMHTYTHIHTYTYAYARCGRIMAFFPSYSAEGPATQSR